MNFFSRVPREILFTIFVLAIAYVLWLFVPYTRTYFLCLIGSYFIAYVIYRLRGEDPRHMFDKSIWLHETSRHEGYILIVSFFVVSFIINKGYIFTSDSFAKVLFVLFEKFHIPVLMAEPSLIAGTFYLIASVLAYEASYYFAHRLLHSNKYLWEFHKVHHSAQVMTPFTSLRQHPVEFMFNALFRAVFIGIVSGVFFYLYPGIPSLVMILQSQLILAAYFFLGGSLAHSHIWLSYGPMDRYVISPAMHQVHHSTNPAHFDKNFGFMLIGFDRLFGTAYIPEKREDLTFGLSAKQNQQFTSLKGIYISPFIRPFKKKKRP